MLRFFGINTPMIFTIVICKMLIFPGRRKKKHVLIIAIS